MITITRTVQELSLSCVFLSFQSTFCFFLRVPPFNHRKRKAERKGKAMATSFVGRAFSNARKTFTHYFNASKEIRGNSVQVARLLASGHALSWRQWRLVQRSRQDTRRIIPFGLMLLLLPEAIPFALRFAPSLVPRTAWTTFDPRPPV